MISRTKLLLSVPLIAGIVIGCSETPQPVVPTPTKAATASGPEKGKKGAAKRKPKEMSSLTGPMDITE